MIKPRINNLLEQKACLIVTKLVMANRFSLRHYKNNLDKLNKTFIDFFRPIVGFYNIIDIRIDSVRARHPNP